MKKTKYLVANCVVFFTFNYPRREEVIDWMIAHPSNHTNKEHLMGKISELMRNYSPAEAWLRFYTDLDTTERDIFTDYICEVYAKHNVPNQEDLERMNK